MSQQSLNPLDILESKLPELIVGAFALVAALAWNEYVKDLVKVYLDDSVKAKFWYAIITTIILVVAITVVGILNIWYRKTKNKITEILNGNIINE